MMTLLRSGILAGLLAGLFIFAPAGSQARLLTLADLRREVTLSNPEISPDGTRIALVVARNDFNHDRISYQLVMVDVEGGAMHPAALLEDDITSLRWSPSGDRLAYLGSSAGGPKQLYLATASGISARKLTNARQGVDSFAWRPDGKAIAYAMEDPPPTKRGSAQFNTSFEVGDNDYLTTAPPRLAHLWVVSTQGGAPTQLTSGASSVPSSELIVPQHFPNQFFCWVSGGKAIVYTRTPDAYQTHWDKSVMMLRNLSSGRERRLTNHTELEAGCDASPDGAHVAYWYSYEGKPLGASHIYVAAVAQTGAGKDVTRNLDRSPWMVRWMPAGRSLLILAHDRTQENIWLAGLDGTVQRLDIGDLNASEASASNAGSIAFIASGPTLPTELYVMRSRNDRPHRLTNYNGYFAGLKLGSVSRVGWENDAGEENGVLTYPPGFVAGKKYPLVLQIHGWPQYASQEAFDTDYPGLTQLLAAHGYLVFEPNYRGSDNMGSAFQTAIAGDTVDGPSRDIMAGIAAVEKFGIVDESRIGVSGWSYGGLLTAWLITHHDWKAAMVGAAPIDLADDYAIGNYNILNKYWYGGPLWASRAGHQLYADQSPITYAWNVNTPTLIMSSVSETTVPIVHSYELFHALRDRGVPTQFIAYPSAEHVPSAPVLHEDIYRRWVGWFDHYMR